MEIVARIVGKMRNQSCWMPYRVGWMLGFPRGEVEQTEESGVWFQSPAANLAAP
jgi:hypothetical protein